MSTNAKMSDIKILSGIFSKLNGLAIAITTTIECLKKLVSLEDELKLLCEKPYRSRTHEEKEKVRALMKKCDVEAVNLKRQYNNVYNGLMSDAQDIKTALLVPITSLTEDYHDVFLAENI